MIQKSKNIPQTASERRRFTPAFFINLLVGLLIASPIIYCLSISFMPEHEIIAYPPRFFTLNPTLENYFSALRQVPIPKFLLNSLFVSVCITLIQITTSSLAAYGFVFFDFKGKKVLFMLVLSTMMIPGEAILISNYLTISSLGLLDSYAGLIIPFMATAMGIFQIRQFYLTVPRELKEASIIDGCSDLKFFSHILFPISMPAVSALAVYVFIGSWNQYMWPLLITNTPAKRTVQIGISMLQFSDGLSNGTVCAGCMLILIPSILIFLLGQQRMVGGITAGAVKG